MNTPVGHWEATFYNDDTPNLTNLATHGICFRANGTWYSTTYANWSGYWFQKGSNAAGNGNRVRIVGNFWEGDGNDSGELDFINNDLMTGPWTEWLDPNGFRVWATTQMKRLSKRCPKRAKIKRSDTKALRRLRRKSPTGAKPSKPTKG